jgi:hypothetical protein
MPPPKPENRISGPTVAERIKRTSVGNQPPPQTIKKEVPSKSLVGGTTQGLVKMRRESFVTDPKKAVNGKVNSTTKK